MLQGVQKGQYEILVTSYDTFRYSQLGYCSYLHSHVPQVLLPFWSHVQVFKHEIERKLSNREKETYKYIIFYIYFTKYMSPCGGPCEHAAVPVYHLVVLGKNNL